MTPLQKLLVADGAFVTPAHVLESLTVKEAKLRLDDVPHSLYEELWHTDFWQRLTLSIIRGEPVSHPDHAAESWPNDNETLTEELWNDLVKRFLADLNAAAELAVTQDLGRSLGKVTVRDEFMSIAVHNAYHFGRMVFLRQLMGLWPPPSGGDTW